MPVAAIEGPAVIKQIPAHLARQAQSAEFNPLSESRVFDWGSWRRPLDIRRTSVDRKLTPGCSSIASV